jgi:hypothetical protein
LLFRKWLCRRHLGLRRLDAAFSPASSHSGGAKQGGVEPPQSKALRAFSYFGANPFMKNCAEWQSRMEPDGFPLIWTSRFANCPCARDTICGTGVPPVSSHGQNCHATINAAGFLSVGFTYG